ncbi:hypothetical protein KFE25_003559 [Diacronema lutheri]|uniref:Uncharacterized protein n=1 Tax=Diacronema lutheri TaxID=2081491 RepID=A0A8J6CAV8_DIALT|nr:hypothetical protein KFE25_003559 [Diacronema lutheri]
MMQMTLEQVVLAVGAQAGCALLLPLRVLPIIPVAAALACAGMLLFWWGCACGATFRMALGFNLAFYPSVMLIFLPLAHPLAARSGFPFLVEPAALIAGDYVVSVTRVDV